MRKSAAWILLGCLVACDGSDPPAPAVLDPARPCLFAAADEIAAVTGSGTANPREVGAHAPAGAPGSRLCVYEVGPPYSSVTLHVETGVSEESFRTRMERDSLNTDPLEGVGELAFTHGGAGVSVWGGDRVASASVQHPGEPDETRRALEDLAALLASKL